eukprot:m.216144 g.216144  ORF g.216144 m.216144 type:complete len:188 (+) comp13802_c0_seq1:148-711(+)
MRSFMLTVVCCVALFLLLCCIDSARSQCSPSPCVTFSAPEVNDIRNPYDVVVDYSYTKVSGRKYFLSLLDDAAIGIVILQLNGTNVFHEELTASSGTSTWDIASKHPKRSHILFAIYSTDNTGSDQQIVAQTAEFELKKYQHPLITSPADGSLLYPNDPITIAFENFDPIGGDVVLKFGYYVNRMVI